jgi:hypothetical protein
MVLCGTVAALAMIASGARANELAVAGTAPAAEATHGARIGVMLVPSPMGRLHAEAADGFQETVRSEPTLTVMTTFDFVPRSTPNLFIGFAPSYTFHVKAAGSFADPGRTFDLLLRFGYSLPIAERFRAYGYLAPGYSFGSGWPDGVTSQGPVLGVHAGGLFSITPSVFLNAELGYQAGFQRAAFDNTDNAFSQSFIQLGLGVGLRV